MFETGMRIDELTTLHFRCFEINPPQNESKAPNLETGIDLYAETN
jgi:hypothetical protein